MKMYSVLVLLALVAAGSALLHHRLPDASKGRLLMRMRQEYQVRLYKAVNSDRDECPADVDHGTCGCECEDGWSGDFCTEHPCEPNPCINGGTCSIPVDHTDGDYVCECPPGYGGPHCDLEECGVEGGPLILLNYDSGTWLNIFIDYTFTCSGRVTEWKFHAKKVGHVFLDVWRARPNNNRWELIGKNKVFVDRLGLWDVKIAEADQIEVEEGDMIGMHYPDDMASDEDDDRGIISYTDTRADGPGLCCNVTDEHLSEIHNKPVMDSELPLGTVVRGLRDFKRSVALHALVHGEFKTRKQPKTLFTG